jgi:hypothetical protein
MHEISPLGAVAAFGLLSCASPAPAQVVSVTANWTVASSCSIAGASISGANLAASGSQSASSTVNCNSGFKINATSAKGALKSTTVAPTNFSNVLPYTLTVAVPVDGTPASTPSASCASSLLMSGSGCTLAPSGAGLSSGGRTAMGQTATLTVAWTIPTLPTRLIAGSYSDTITLSIATVP